MLGQTGNAIPFATLTASPSLYYSTAANLPTGLPLMLLLNRICKTQRRARIPRPLLSVYVCFASGGDAREAACGYFYAICLT